MDNYEQFYYGHSNAEQFIAEHLKDQSNNVPLGLAANPYILKKLLSILFNLRRECVI